MTRIGTNKPRVVYWNNIPAPYMVDRFNVLVDRGAIDFEAWFSSRTEPDRSWAVDEKSWRFRYRYLHGIGGAVLPPLTLLRPNHPDVLVSLYSGAPYIVGSSMAAARGARTAYWLEVTFDAWVARRRWKEALKRVFLPRADAVLTAGLDGQSYAEQYGVDRKRIFVVPHVIDYERYKHSTFVSSSDRDRARAELGARGVTFLYVGRLWRGKGLYCLCEAFARLQRDTPFETSLLLAGDGVDEVALRERVRELHLKNVSFLGFHGEDALRQIYQSADVFVFPTLGDPFGMVVLEAMASGLPVIASAASGEIRTRITDGEHGYIVPPDDGASLYERMRRLANDPHLRRTMAANAQRHMEGQSVAQWADAFEQAISAVIRRKHSPDDTGRKPS